MSPVLAADIGGTNLRLAVVNEAGEVVNEQRIEAQLSRADASSPAEAETQLMQALISAIHPFAASHEITAIGIGFPGFFDHQNQLLRSSPNIPMLANFPLAAHLSEALNLPVAVENDALCAAIGEQRFGAGQGCDNLLHITLGTGIGGGLILNNAPYGGERGMAMEFGHLCVEPGGRTCGCGNQGCVEAYASATAISRRYLEASGEALSTKAIYQLAQQGDESAKEIIQSAGHYLGMAIAESVKLLDITTITLSGGLCGAWPLLEPAILETLNRQLIPPLQGRIDIRRSQLDDRSGILGAAYIATRHDDSNPK